MLLPRHYKTSRKQKTVTKYSLSQTVEKDNWSAPFAICASIFQETLASKNENVNIMMINRLLKR